MEMTVNALLSMQKALKQRQTQLETTKSSSTMRTRRIARLIGGGEGTETIEEPIYNIKLLDKKVTEINKALLKIDQEIKRSNAKTTVELPTTIDFDALMTEVE